MKNILLSLFLMTLFSFQAFSQSTKEKLYGTWYNIENVTDADSKCTINIQYIFKSGGIGSYKKDVKQSFNNKRANPSMSIAIGFSWSIVGGNLKIVFDKKSSKQIDANPSEEKWRSGADFWSTLLERKYYKNALDGQTINISFSNPKLNELILDGMTYQKQ